MLNHEAPNIMLLTIDGLRPDHLGCYGYHKNTSPNIDRLTLKGTSFLQAISNGGGTPQAFPSILASALPPLNIDEFGTIMKRSTSIAEVLRGNGYATAAFHSCPFLARSFYYHKGFATFVDNLRPLGRIHEWQLKQFLSNPKGRFHKLLGRLFDLLIIAGLHTADAEKINGRVISWLRKNNQKFFVWVHYMDTHRMSGSPKALRRFGSHSISRLETLTLHYGSRKAASKYDRELLINRYDANIRYVDDCVGLLLNELGERLDNTIIIVTGDHGDEFGERERFGHRTLYDEIIHVPLIFRGPGVRANRLVNEQVSLMDIAPTIVDILNLGEDKGFRGESLLPLLMKGKKRPRYAISTSQDEQRGERKLSYRAEGWKYIRTERLNSGEVIQQELYDLINDQGETRNLYEQESEKARGFELKILSLYSAGKSAEDTL